MKPVLATETTSRPNTLSRRDLLAGTATLGLATAGASFLGIGRALAAEGLPSGNWGSIVKIADGVWAVASTPLAHRDFKTVCNGGIVAGRDRVLVVEAFAGRSGAQWVAKAAEQLTGRWPTDIVVTHYHGDHTGGITGFMRDGFTPKLYGTQATLERLAVGDDAAQNQEGQDKAKMLAEAHHIAEGQSYEAKFMDRPVTFSPRGGHTASDVTVELPDLDLGFGGDLVWNAMIPNFVDARPARLAATLAQMRDGGTSRYVPGHGALGEPKALAHNIDLVDLLGEAASRSLESGQSAAEAAAELELPSPFDSWVAFNPNYVERAIGAWRVDLEAAG